MPTTLSGLRQKVFFDRYALKDAEGERIEQTPEEMWRRVARAISLNERTPDKQQEWEEQFYHALEGFKFVPGGRILTGAGSGVDLTFYNCYVIPSPDDSRAGIFESVRTMVEIMSRGGGVGVNLSTLRPRGSYVRGVNGTASGAVSFGGLYSYATGLIIQGGSRRGALMLMLNDDHPDIEEFITVKRTMGLITNANLSVCVSDRFMEVLERDGDWDLQWGGKIYKTIKARHLWNLICESAHAAGEPGAVFMERYNKESNSWYFEKIISVNPCVTGDTRVSTNQGLKTIHELYEAQQHINITTDSRLHNLTTHVASAIMQTGVKDVYRLHTKEGYSVKLTADHRMRTEDGWKEAQQLQPGENILLLNQKGGFGNVGSEEWGQVLGWFVGDGHFNQAKETAVLSFFGEEKQELAPQFMASVNALLAEHHNQFPSPRSYHVGVGTIDDRCEARISSTRLATILQIYGMTPATKLAVPQPVWEGTEEMQRGFLQGLFTADGHVAGSVAKGVSVRLSSISATLLSEVQQLLLNFGIVSRLYRNRRTAAVRELPDGHGGLAPYACQAQHDLVISKNTLALFAKEIGFLSEKKNQKLIGLLANYTRGPYVNDYTATFVALEYIGKEMVYDLTEPVTHSFVANGLVVHNCGEQGLGAWNVCNLGAINLATFVNENGEFHREGLRETVRCAIRFLDNVIDTTPYFYKENRDAQMRIRRTGLGTMGLADALIKLKIRYGSDEALAWCDDVYRLIRDEAYRMSMEIAKEKGAFPAFESEKFMQGKFIMRLPADLQEEIRKYGVRNGVLLTQAPTGTTSILAGVSSGIEPVYDFAFIRKDRLGEHIVYHPLFEEWKAQHPDAPDGDGERPTYFVTAKTLAPLEHVKMQAVAQKYTDSSISKTVNAPNAHTLDDVKELYIQAYKMGCKGVTYYREGSRDVSVLDSLDSGKNKEKEQKPTESPSSAAPVPRTRPEVVMGATYKIKTGYGTMFVTINHDEQTQPFEVFATIGKAGGFFAAKSEAICRLISLALRSGIDVATVIDQLKGIRGPMPSWGKNGQILSIPDAIAQVLEMHLKDGQQKLNLQFAKETDDASNETLEGGDALLHDPEVESAEHLGLPTQKEENHSQASVMVSSVTQTRVSIADVGVAPECPECAGILAMQEGCMMCHSCGFSKCA